MEMFTQFTQDIFDITNGYMICDNSTISGYCTSNQTCASMYADKDTTLHHYNFRVGLKSNIYAQLPIASLMYQDTNECRLYVMNLDCHKPMGTNFILGIPFFQNFFANFAYNNRNGLSNEVTLYQSPTAYSTALIGSNVYPNQTSPFTTVSNPYISVPDTPSVDPSPPKKHSSLEVLYISIGAMFFMLISIGLCYLCCRCTIKTDKDKSLGFVYTEDRGSLIEGSGKVEKPIIEN